MDTLVPSSWAASSHATIKVDAGADGPVISPHVQGQFLEHLGGVIYDGVWVGKNSMRESARTEDVIEKHWAAAAKFDPEHKMKFVLDEWGVWYRTGEEIAPEYILSQPLTLRDALHTAITLDIFNRHAGKLAMCNVAQTVMMIGLAGPMVNPGFSMIMSPTRQAI